MIVQINVYICDQCKEVKVEKKVVCLWADPLVDLPEKWADKQGELLCPKCGDDNIK